MTLCICLSAFQCLSVCCLGAQATQIPDPSLLMSGRAGCNSATCAGPRPTLQQWLGWRGHCRHSPRRWRWLGPSPRCASTRLLCAPQADVLLFACKSLSTLSSRMFPLHTTGCCACCGLVSSMFEPVYPAAASVTLLRGSARALSEQMFPWFRQ